MERANQLQAVHSRHADVGNEHIAGLGADRIQGLVAIANGADDRTRTLQNDPQQVQRVSFIVDGQYANTVEPWS